MTERKIWKKGLSILLIFQIIVAFSLATFDLVNFPAFTEQFGMKYHSDMDILQPLMAYNLFLSVSISLWSVIWIRKGNIAGIQAAITCGFLMFIVSMALFIKFDRIDMLLFDGLRALVMVVFGVMAYREHTKFQTTIS